VYKTIKLAIILMASLVCMPAAFASQSKIMEFDFNVDFGRPFSVLFYVEQGKYNLTCDVDQNASLAYVFLWNDYYVTNHGMNVVPGVENTMLFDIERENSQTGDGSGISVMSSQLTTGHCTLARM